jgi:DNA replication protein DnaC
MGLREPKCPDCGATVPTKLKDISPWLSVWDPEIHVCTEREERERKERDEREKREREWRENPPDMRIREVFHACRFPADSPQGGLKLIRHKEVDIRLIQAVKVHREFWLKGLRPEKGLWVHGPTDQRKTTVLAALGFDIAHRTGRRVLFWNLADLMEHIRLDARRKENEYDPSAINAAEVLILDDLGTLKITDTAWERVFHMVENAKSGWGGTKRRQTLYVTSNEAPEAMIDHLSPPSDASGGERIVRRLRQICDVVEVGL